MIRVTLPAHLRKLAQVDGEVKLDVEGPITQRAVLDALDPCGVYFGTTGGQVYASADAGDTWAPIVRDLPAVVSVEVQTLPPSLAGS
jgi:hypothetical protein